MSFENYFRLSSYAMVAGAMLSLALAGGIHPGLTIAFALVMFAAWKMEGSKWQLSERAGLVVVLMSVPLFILDWQYQKTIGDSAGRYGVTALAHLIVFLAAVKLVQVKKDRDWVFLYLISFFEVLLAAGLSFSPVFLFSLCLYLLSGLSTIIAFEIQKRKRLLPPTETRLLVPPDSRIFAKSQRSRGRSNVEVGRLPLVTVVLLVLIFVLALPLFLVAPRSGVSALTRGGAGLANFIGFSESVSLGEIGDLKRDSALVMHVRLEGTEKRGDLRWRGVALDEFTGRGWKKSAAARRTDQKVNDKGLFQLGTTASLNRVTTQTVFLEPIESPVLFAASRPIAVQGDFSSLRVDAEGSVQIRRLGFERIMYKAISDTTAPDPEILRSDRAPYPEAFERYLQLPETINPRIMALANAMIVNAHARTRYDQAKAIESQLQQDFGYSMQMRAGGADPLSDFLFNVKSGHCEYFSTAMAVMLRTRGIASRVVNGFLPGEYNEAAGAYTVRQSDAHSWVEVYFPETRSWVTFDPTPAAGRIEPVSAGLGAQLGKYAAALELLWFQYVVGYDRQEQRSLAASLSNQVARYRRLIERGATNVAAAIASQKQSAGLVIFGLAAAALLILIVRRVSQLGWRRGLSVRLKRQDADRSSVEFYERLTALLARQGVQRESHLTPLEFAGNLDVAPALVLTRAYNRVRFGGEKLSAKEAKEIEHALQAIEQQESRKQKAESKKQMTAHY